MNAVQLHGFVCCAVCARNILNIREIKFNHGTGECAYLSGTMSETHPPIDPVGVRDAGVVSRSCDLTIFRVSSWTEYKSRAVEKGVGR